MDEVLKELDNLSDVQKINTLKKIIDEKRKKVIYYVALKNLHLKNNDLNNFQDVKNTIKELKQQIETLQKVKDNILIVKPEEKKKNKKEEAKIELVLKPEEIILLNHVSNDNHEKQLTNFDNIEIPLLEHLLSLKEKYVFYRKKENDRIKKLKRSICILVDIGSIKAETLKQQLDEKLATKRTISKIIKYLDKLIKLEYKRINNINRKEKRLIETLFAERYGISDYQNDENYTVEEIYSTYYELVFKEKDMHYINSLLEQFPDLYILKNKKRLFYEDILDRYTNILLNKNYIGKDKKAETNLQELEYYRSLILKYLSYSFENSDTFIAEITVKKIERILYLLNNNDIYNNKSKAILEQINYLKEVIRLGNLSVNDNSNIKEIKGEYIFSIDNDKAKIMEDALSISKKDENYYISFYTPDIVSFVEPSSVLDKKAFERFKNFRKRNYALPQDTIQFFKLIQGRKKRVIGYHFVIDENGNLRDLKIERNIVKLYNSYSFEEFNALLCEGKDKNALYLKELYCLLENKSDVTSSSNILKGLILNCGTILGRYLNVKDIPCIYKNLEDGTVHSIPNKDYYVEFTSPLRSYISIMNQRILVNGKQIHNIEKQCLELNKQKLNKRS